METEESLRHHMSDIELRFRNVIDSYNELLSDCRLLADAMAFSQDYVIGKVMPSKASERNDTYRIEDWFHGCKESALQTLMMREAKERAEKEKHALVERLNLTEKEKQLLGL